VRGLVGDGPEEVLANLAFALDSHDDDIDVVGEGLELNCGLLDLDGIAIYGVDGRF
jgi:hypothetical protein